MDDDALAAALAKLEDDGAGPEVRAAFERRFAQLQDPQAGLLHGDDLEPLTDADVPRLDDLDAGDPQAILDRVVVIKLNGGLGTSMGLQRPEVADRRQARPRRSSTSSPGRSSTPASRSS